jgi:hypothetical protein
MKRKRRKKMPLYKVTYWVKEARDTLVYAGNEDDACEEVALGNEGNFDVIGSPEIIINSIEEIIDAEV